MLVMRYLWLWLKSWHKINAPYNIRIQEAFLDQLGVMFHILHNVSVQTNAATNKIFLVGIELAGGNSKRYTEWRFHDGIDWKLKRKILRQEI